jgi:hypothetical protein
MKKFGGNVPKVMYGKYIYIYILELMVGVVIITSIQKDTLKLKLIG